LSTAQALEILGDLRGINLVGMEAKHKVDQ
jgi:hypothetical protein